MSWIPPKDSKATEFDRVAKKCAEDPKTFEQFLRKMFEYKEEKKDD